MKQTVDLIRKKFKVDGENEKYIEIYNDKKEVLEQMDQEGFEAYYNVKLDKVKFPVVVFDNQNAVPGWIYQSGTDQEEILEDAEEFFDKK